MIGFAFGVIVLIAGIVLVVGRRRIRPEQPLPVAAGGVVAFFAAFVIIFLSTAIHVGDGEGGLVIRKIFGGPMKDGHIIAANGENGPQAEVLPPGWHFWYWPWD